MRRWKQRALEAEADAQRYKDNYLGACQTIAAMHAAAFGGEVRGPGRGVVEDIEDLYARAQQSDGHGLAGGDNADLAEAPAPDSPPASNSAPGEADA